MDGKQYGTWGTLRVENSIKDLASRISMDLMINCVMLLSMMVQLMLALGGAFRHCCPSSILQLVIWLAYMSADALAIYALGTMAQSHSRAMFGIWAPILLSHLGGPDAISAYSTLDNELWLRHLLTMLCQILVAAYVMYASQLGGYMLPAALLLLMVGVSKYVERIMALRSSSSSHIVSSANPMNVFMLVEGEKCNYLVMGLKQWTKNREAKVTINDVWESEGKVFTENYLLCLSHALFKMAMRRYVNLSLRERYYNITREFLFAEDLSHIASPMKIFTVVEVEMKFLYDFLFSKSGGTAFSKVGTVMRLVNMCLLGVSGFLVYSELRSQRPPEEALYAQHMVASVLVSVALVLEMVQICRVFASDWTMVWLVCARIRHSRGRKGMDSYIMAIVIQTAFQISGSFRKYFCRGKYWRGQIPQYSIIDTCSHLSPSVWNLTKILRLTRFVSGWYTQAEPAGDDVKSFFVEQLKGRCLGGEDLDKCRTRLMSYDSILEENKCEDFKWASARDHEHLILHWHIATTICEMEYDRRERSKISGHEEEVVKKNVGVSTKLSRYCAYLLVWRPDLLPLHPDIARAVHMDVHNELVALADFGYNTVKTYTDFSTLGQGAKLARDLLQKTEEQRWKIISDYWAGVMIFYAMKNKASIHAKQLAVGGEFLTLLWAIVGHMGMGDQWETIGLGRSRSYVFARDDEKQNLPRYN